MRGKSGRLSWEPQVFCCRGNSSILLRNGGQFFSSQHGGRIYTGVSNEVQGERRYMPKFVIEREIPGAGAFSPEQLQAISQTSCGVLRTMGPEIQWIHSYVTADKIYCVYFADNEELVKEHAKKGGFPANRVSKITSMIDPATAEA
jgi:hypothetical protein